MDDERKLFSQIIECLSDENAVASIVFMIENFNADNSDIDMNNIVGQVGSVSKFSALFERLVGEQAQPFLIYRGINNTIESNLYPNSTDSLSIDYSKAIDVSAKPDSKGKLLVPKTKTRVAPTIISTTSAHIISVETKKSESNYPNTTFPSKVLPNDAVSYVANSFTSPNSKQQPTTSGSVVRTAPLSSSGICEVSSLASSLTTPSKIKLIRLGVSMEIIPISTVHRQSSNAEMRTTDANSIIPVKISNLKSFISYNNEINIDKNASTSPEDLVNNNILNMSKIYCALVRYQYIPISICVPFLAKLAGLTFPENFKIKLNLTYPELFPTLLLDDHCLKIFIATTINALNYLLTAFGPSVSSLFAASSESFKDIIPNISTKLLASQYELDDDDSSNDDYYNATDYNLYNSVSGVNDGNYIRPFREEVDNRHEYKSQIETAVYNEREKCYDEFSNLIRNFITLNKMDLDGSKIEDFWQSLPSSGQKVLSLRDCNFPWFAEVFKSMLLFYGLNTPIGSLLTNTSNGTVSTTADSVNTSGSIPGSTSFTNQNSQSSLTGEGGGSKDRTLPLNRGPSTSTGNTTSTQLHPSKERLLEARMGPGGKGQVASGRRPPPNHNGNSSSNFNANQQLNQKLRLLYTSYQNPSIHFPGNQQFFFRFIVVLDCHRFCRFLASSLAAEISLLTGSEEAFQMTYFDSLTFLYPPSELDSRSEYSTGTNTTSSSTNGNTNNYRKESPSTLVAKLRLLGRFLGLLYFWPYWSYLSVGERLTSQGPLRILASETNRNWMLLRDTLPIERLLDWAFRTCKLSYVIPWIAEFLKMMEWTDGHGSDFTNPYYSTLTRLRAIQYTSLFTISKDRKLSGNRMHILIEIQETLTSLAFPTAKEIPALDHILHHYNDIYSAAMNVDSGQKKGQPVDCGIDSKSNIFSSDRLLSNGMMSLWPWMHDVSSSLTVKKLHHSSPHKSATITNTRTTSSSNTSSSIQITVPPFPSPPPASTSTSSSFLSATSPIKSSLNPNSSCQSSSNNRNNNNSVSINDTSTSNSVHSNSTISNNIINSNGKVNEINNLVKRSRNGSTSNLLVSVSSPTSTGTTRSQLPKRTTSTVSQSTTATSGNRINNSNNNKNGSSNVAIKITDKLKSGENILIASFWQQHPQLQQLSSFLLEQLHHALRSRMKLLVTEAVHKAWFMVEVVRGELDNNSYSNSISGDNNISNDIIEGEYKMALEKEMNKIHASTLEDSIALLDRYLEERLKNLMTDLTTLHPVHERVSAMAVHLTLLQAQAQRSNHTEFLNVYLRRKLSEVVTSSISQYDRARVNTIRNEENNLFDNIVIIPPKLKDSSYSINRIFKKGAGYLTTLSDNLLIEAIQKLNKYFIFTSVENNNNDNNNNSSYNNNNSYDTTYDGVDKGDVIEYFLSRMTYNWSIVSLLSQSLTTTTSTSTTITTSKNVRILNDLTGLCLSTKDFLKVVIEQILAFQNTANSSICSNSNNSSNGNNNNKNSENSPTTPPPPPSNKCNDKPSIWKSKDTLTQLGFQCHTTTTTTATTTTSTNSNRMSSSAIISTVWDFPKICLLIQSTIRYLLHLLVILKYSLDVIQFDMRGRVKIELCKLFTVTAPYLLYLDNFCNLNNIKILEDWKKYESKLTQNYYLSKEISITPLSYPSDVMIAAIQLNLISIGALSRSLTACCRSSSLVYFEVCRGLTHTRALQPQTTLSLLWRYLCQTQVPASTSFSSTPQVKNMAILPLDMEEDWYLDPSLIRAIKTNICDDLADLVLYLSKLEA